MNTGDLMLKIDKLSFSYNNNEILKKIDLYLQEKEFVGIIGPNGSGKTTLLKNISHIFSPDSGVIYLNQRQLNDYSNRELARFMAVVPQDTAIDYNFTVYDLIMMGRNPYQDRWGRVKDEDKAIVEEAMELTDTVKFRDKRIDELSGGERQRVIIARVLAQKPGFLLLDEPTASLDINYQGEIFDLLANLNKELKLTIVIVSHDLNLSSQYCSKLVFLKEGEIFKVGRPEEVLTLQNIKEVYHTEVIIKDNPLTNRPFIILTPKKKESRKTKRKERIHVICGGGSARELLQHLYLDGYQLSCGILNKGDSDWEMAKRLNTEIVEIPPFSSIDEASLEKNRLLLERADLIITTETPFGHGNLANICQLEQINKEIIFVNVENISDRDYTGGKAEECWQRLSGRKNIYQVENLESILNLTRNLLP